MTDLRPVWFLPRTRDRQPAEAIRLGDIIASPHEPEDTINFTDPPEILPTKLKTIEQRSWSWTTEFPQSSSGRGLLALFLSLTSLGADTEAGKHREIYTAERLVTEYFIPDKTYITQCLEDEDVEYAMTGPNRKKGVYMITGVKTAYGATFTIETPREPETPAQTGEASSSDITVDNDSKEHYQPSSMTFKEVNANDNARVQNGNIIVQGSYHYYETGPGAIVTQNEAALSQETHSQHMFSEKQTAAASDFIFAYQLWELKYNHGQIEQKRYDQGALFGRDDDGGRKVATDESPSIDNLGLQEVDLSSLDSMHRTVTDETGEVVECVLPYVDAIS